MKHTKELMSLALASLVPSPFNVRRHSAGRVELAALIKAQCLLRKPVLKEQKFGLGSVPKRNFAVADRCSIAAEQPVWLPSRCGIRRQDRLSVGD